MYRSKRDENETKGEFHGSDRQDVFIQQCECHAQVSIASLLPLLSAIATVESQHTRGFGSLSNQMRAPLGNEKCEDYSDISTWMDEHVKLHAQWSNFKAELDTLLIPLNVTTSLKKCWFYEETTLQSIIENVNAIDQSSGIQKEQIKYSADMETDLENILSNINKPVVKGFKNCCKNLRDSIKNLKDDLKTSVQDLSRKLNDSENSREKEELHNNLKDFEDQIKDLKARLHTLQNKVGEFEANTKCCAEIERQIQDLDIILKTRKSEADVQNQELYNKIKEFKDKQRTQDDLTTALKLTIRDRGENIKNIIDKCEKHCGNENLSDDTQFEKGELLELEMKIENLERLVEKLSNKLSELDTLEPTTNLNASLHACLKNGENLSKIQYELQELIKTQSCSKASSDAPKTAVQWPAIGMVRRNAICISDENLEYNIKELQKEVLPLREELNYFTKCCQKIYELGAQADHLKNTQWKMNQTYNEHIKSHENQFKHIKEGLYKALMRFSDINQSNINEGLEQQLNNLDNKLNKVNLNLEIIKERQGEISKLIKNTKYAETLPNEMAMLRSNFDEFEQKVDTLLKDIKENKLSELLVNKKDREKQLETLNVIVRQDLDKLKQKLLHYDDLEKRIKEKIVQLKTPTNLMLGCHKKCKGTSKINDLIDQIEDAEKLVKAKGSSWSKLKPISKSIPKSKPTQKPKPKPTRKKRTSKSDVKIGDRRHRSVYRSKRDENETKGEFHGSDRQDVFIQQCECHAQVSIASLLPLLSAIAAVESQHTRGFESLSNQMRAPLGNEKCGDYNDISTWMDEQKKLHAQWRNFMAELLISLNGTTSLKKCCLFEETNLKLVIENINAIDQDSGNQEGQLKYSGDLGTDLENILLKIKEAVAQGFKSCCDNLQDVVKNLKDKLEEKLQDLTGNSNEVNPKISREKDELQNKLNDLKDKIKDLKERLETLETSELLNERTQSCFEAGGSRTFAIYNDKSISNSNCTFDKKLQDRIRELEQEEESLREELKKPPKCCQKIDELSLETNQLQSMLKEMNRSYNDTLKEYENQFKDIEESTNESVKKMGDINKTKNNESLQEKIKNLTKELDKANITLETLKDKQSDLFNSNNSSNNATNMLVELASLKRDFNEFRDNVDRQLKDIEGQQLFSLSADAKDSLQLLENFNNDISRDMDKIKKNLLDRDSLAKQTQDQIAELKNQADIMLECQKRCTKINKMNDFIDRIEDMENLVKNL
uniref:Interaptin n=1 Tax=Drosophila rhopaloa TaxID=1041015 RepID=A0A6P4FS05_DRORH